MNIYYRGKRQEARSTKLNNLFFILNRSVSGFTLLEIMIALAIIGTTVTVVLHTVNYHADVLFENTITTRMYQMAKEKMYDLEMAPKKSKGKLDAAGFTYENIISQTEYPDIIELKTIVRGHGKEVMLRELIIIRADRGRQKYE
jgi:prepilin-type N-terminal cleavage/methylation domain-containing protein